MVLAGAAALSVAAAFTVPFTWQADLVTAALVAAVAGRYAHRVWRRRTFAGEGSGGDDASSGGSGRAGDAGGPRQRGAGAPATSAWRAARPWAVWAACVVGWELWNYAHAARSAYPTLSSMADVVTRSTAGRAVLFFAVSLLGWYLATWP